MVTAEISHHYDSLTSKERQVIFGIECPDHLEWSGWQPGGEYSRKLVVRNVSNHTVKFKYKLPRSKYFSMAFPEPMSLMAGMSVPLKITFRPIKLVPYSDDVKLITDHGSFSVAICASIPQARVEVPVQLDFGFCAVNEPESNAFHVQNVGDLPVNLTWKAPLPFTIQPAICSDLKPGDSHKFVASFVAAEAVVYTGAAICILDQGSSTVTNMTAIGKFSFLQLGEELVDHGSVLAGVRSHKTVRLMNQSLVPARFTIAESGGKEDKAMRLYPTSGCIEPAGSLELTAEYAPGTLGMLSTKEYLITTPGAPTITFKQRGTSVGATVALSLRALGFGDVELGHNIRKVFAIENQSDVSVPFSICAPARATFSIEPVCGILKPYATAQIVVTFTPTFPSNYWKRLCILLANSEPLDIDMYGTGYSPSARPPPIHIHHIDDFLHRVGQGGPIIPPSLEEGVCVPGTPCAILPPSLFGNHSWDLVFEGQDVTKAMQLSADVLSFKSTSQATASESQTIYITNDLSFDLTACVHAPRSAGAKSSYRAWVVTPDSVDLTPGETATFEVSFKPQVDGEYCTSFLEVVAFVKYMRNFRLCSEGAEVPPFQRTIMLSGDSLDNRGTSVLPQVRLSTRSLSFPPCPPTAKSHITLTVQNQDSTPVQVFIRPGDLPQEFSFFPNGGVVPPKGTLVIATQFSPSSTKPVSGKAQIVLNGNTTDSPWLTLAGCANDIRVELDSSTLLCKPTCIGSSSVRSFQLTNRSTLPAAFSWDIPSELSNVFSVRPMCGVVAGNSHSELQCTYSPASSGKVSGLVKCCLRGGITAEVEAAFPDGCPAGLNSSARLDGALSVELVGVAAEALISINPVHTDIGQITVGQPVRIPVTVSNGSVGAVKFAISAVDASGNLLEVCAPGDDFESGKKKPARDPAQGLEVSAEKLHGIIAGRASVDLDVVFKAHTRMNVNFDVVCTYGQAAEEVCLSSSSPQATCTIMAVASLPTIQIADASCLELPRHVLWQMLNLSELNSLLFGAVTAKEAWILDQEQNNGMDLRDVLLHLDPLKLDFGVLQLGTRRTVQIHFHNSERLDVSWQLGGPDLPDLDLETWIEPCRPRNQDEKLAEFILDRKIFTYSPTSGHLSSGDGITITMHYTAEALGTHSLPLQLQIQDGRRLRLDLVARCVEQSTQQAFLPGAQLPSQDGRIKLRDAQLADDKSPMQMFSIQNTGPAELSWKLDLEPLNQLKKDNWGHEVLALVGPESGTCSPGCAVTLNWLFTPVLPEIHQVDIPLHVGANDSTMAHTLTVTGKGVVRAAREERVSDWESSASRTHRIPSNPLIQLSPTFLDLGETICNGCLRRLVVLQSSSQEPVWFQWVLGEFDGSGGSEGILSFEPSHGELQPGERLACLVTYQAHLETQWLQGDVVLVVSNSDKLCEDASARQESRDTSRRSSCVSGAYSHFESHKNTAAHGTMQAHGEQKDQGAWGEVANDTQLFAQHVPVKGAVLSGTHLMQIDTQPDGHSSSKLQSSWTTARECTADDAEEHPGCKDGEAEAMPGSESKHVASGGDAVFEVLHTALREIMMETGLNTAVRSRAGATEAAAASQMVTAPSETHHASSMEMGVHAASFLHPPRSEMVDEQTQGTQVEAQGEADGITAPDDALLSRTKANFMEYVLERMLFGVMQEVVAADTEL